MSTVSCFLPNKPGDDIDLGYLVPTFNHMKGHGKILWLLASLLTTIQITIYEENDKYAGFTVGMTAIDFILMLLATLMLTKGVKDNIWPLVVPWILLSAYECQSGIYQEVVQISRILFSETMPRIFWAMWACYLAVLILRINLIIRTGVYTFHQWYAKKLRQELLSSE